MPRGFGILLVRRFRFAVLLVSVATLSGCASRPGPSALVTVTGDVPGAQQVTVLAVTTRGRAEKNTNVYTSVRSPERNFARFTLSIPPDHKRTAIELPKGKPDPRHSFAVTSQAVLSEAEFGRAVSPAREGPVGLFVHGYNTNFQEALFRLAQMSADSGLLARPVLFAWGSQGSLGSYIADKEAATYSRDYLAATMAELARGRKKGEVVVIAHSMGGWLTVEAIRQLKLQGRDDVVSRLRVILAAPDIDVDVFRSQMQVIGKLDPPLTILVSADDRALQISQLINESNARVGAISIDTPGLQEVAAAANVRIIDISRVDNPDATKHNRYAEVNEIYPYLLAERRKSVGETGALVLDTAGKTLTSPLRLVSKVLQQP